MDWRGVDSEMILDTLLSTEPLDGSVAKKSLFFAMLLRGGVACDDCATGRFASAG